MKISVLRHLMVTFLAALSLSLIACGGGGTTNVYVQSPPPIAGQAGTTTTQVITTTATVTPTGAINGVVCQPLIAVGDHTFGCSVRYSLSNAPTATLNVSGGSNLVTLQQGSTAVTVTLPVPTPLMFPLGTMTFELRSNGQLIDYVSFVPLVGICPTGSVVSGTTCVNPHNTATQTVTQTVTGITTATTTATVTSTVSTALGSITSIQSCTVATSAATCTGTVSWSIARAASPEIRHNGNLVSSQASGTAVVIMSLGSNTFVLHDVVGGVRSIVPPSESRYSTVVTMLVGCSSGRTAQNGVCL